MVLIMEDEAYGDEPHPFEGRPAGSRSPVEDEEVVYYEGSPLLRGELGLLFLWLAMGLVLIAVPILWWFVGDAAPPYWAWLFVVAGALLILFPSLWVKRHRYKVTNYRIDHEFGLITTNIDTLELWHINDIRMRQGPIDKLFRVGTIRIDADDRSTPNFELRSVANPRPLYESLKQRVISVKRQRGVIKMDTGG